MKSKAILLTSLKITHLCCSTFNACRCFASSKNPYKVLGLENDCSVQDVKQAYIKLCKKLHPDMKPGDRAQHKKFVELNDAYTTLANAQTRRRYDTRTDATQGTDPNTYYHEGGGARDQQWYEREEYWHHYHRSNSRYAHNKGDTGWTLWGCFVLVVIGALLNYSAYSFATFYTRSRVDEKSKKISENYKNIRDKALAGNNKEHIERLERKWSE